MDAGDGLRRRSGRLAELDDELVAAGAQVVAVSTGSYWSHRARFGTEPALRNVRRPVLADTARPRRCDPPRVALRPGGRPQSRHRGVVLRRAARARRPTRRSSERRRRVRHSRGRTSLGRSPKGALRSTPRWRDPCRRVRRAATQLRAGTSSRQRLAINQLGLDPSRLLGPFAVIATAATGQLVESGRRTRGAPSTQHGVPKMPRVQR